MSEQHLLDRAKIQVRYETLHNRMPESLIEVRDYPTDNLVKEILRIDRNSENIWPILILINYLFSKDLAAHTWGSLLMLVRGAERNM